MRKYLNDGLAVGVLVAAGVLGPSAVNASLLYHGITYDLEAQIDLTNPLIDHMALKITGINDATDVTFDGGYKANVNAFAIVPPANLVGITMTAPPSGWTQAGTGLNSTGCNMSNANFVCMDNAGVNDADSTTFGPPLAANSTLIYDFDVTVSSGSLAAFNAALNDIKIDWVGWKDSAGTMAKNNFDLVSHSIDITPDAPPTDVPAPGNTLGLLGIGLIGTVGAVGWKRRRQSFSV
jgi:hypothetical protein